MNEKKILNRILTQPFFQAAPPVLVDIGASGEIHGRWSRMAEHCICVAFDADSRDFSFVENDESEYRKLFIFRAVVSNKPSKTLKFFLTTSPHCSSALKPDTKSLDDWDFSNLFTVTQDITLPAITISKALKEIGVSYVDWFKTDSQGCDLRLFRSLGESMIRKMIIAEFEPGIIDAYIGEDKFYKIMTDFDKRDFLMLELDVRGTRWASGSARRWLAESKIKLPASVAPLPCWVGVTYLNKFREIKSERELFLGCTVALLHKQYIMAIDLARKGYERHKNPIFNEIVGYCYARLKWLNRFEYLEQIKMYLISFLRKTKRKIMRK